MPVLLLKLVRELWADRNQYLAVCSMVMLGVMFYGAAYMSYRNLEISYDHSYGRLRFEDFGIAFHAAPEQVVERVRRIPGVKAAEGRLVEDVALELPGRTTKRLVGRLISIPADRRPLVNDLRVIEGRYLSGRSAREILLEASFARHHRIRPGYTVEVVRGGGRARLLVAGIAQSPEYVFVVRSKQDIMPFPETFGVMFVSEDVLRPLVGKVGLINEIRATVEDADRLPAAMREARRLLAAYRPEDPVPREDQPSYQLLEQDLQGFQAYAVLFPMLFLGVAGSTVYTLLMRMVHRQRPIIGLLRALGFVRRRVVLHYLCAAALVGALGSAAGSGLGYVLAGWTTRWYATFLSVPYIVVIPQWGVLAAGLLIGTGVCLLAGVLPARSAARVRPAEALRAAAPAAGRVVPLDRVVPGLRNARIVWRLPVRNLFRHPRRTASTLFGVAAAIALMMVARGLLDSAEAALNLFVGDVIRDDMRLEFMGFQDRSVVNRVRGWPGVIWAEGTLEVPVEFERGTRRYSAVLVGLEPGTRLQYLENEDGTEMSVSAAGLLLGQTLRQRLGVEEGDVVLLSLPRSLTRDQPRVRAARVAGFVWQPIGTIAYMPLDRVRQLFREDLPLPVGAVTGVRVKADPRYLGEIRQRLLDLPGAGAVQVQADIRRMFDSLMAQSRRFIWIMFLFGMALAFSITFSMITINVLERTSEVATMRTIGVGRWRIFCMITAENLLTSALGVCAGLPLGRALVEMFFRAAQTAEQAELFSMKVVVSPSTYALAAAAVVLVVFLSQIPSIVQVGRLDLARATKEQAG
jgi:putative ABC transport system permease protein